MQRAGAGLRICAWASPCGGFSCGAWALGTWASEAVAHGLSCPRQVESSWTRDCIRVPSNWQVDSYCWTIREAPFSSNFKEEIKRYPLFQEVYSFWSLLDRLFVLFLGHKPQNHFGQKVVFCQYLYGVSLEVNSAHRLMTSLTTPL